MVFFSCITSRVYFPGLGLGLGLGWVWVWVELFGLGLGFGLGLCLGLGGLGWVWVGLSFNFGRFFLAALLPKFAYKSRFSGFFVGYNKLINIY